MKDVNYKIEHTFGIEDISAIDIYKEMISDIEFSTALHLGSGRDKHELYELLTDDGEIIALDPDRTSLERNSSSFKIQGDGAQLPFEDDTFDIVFSEYVFEHLPEPADALAEINRVCRPNGSIVILVPNPLHYYAIVADNTPFWFHNMWLKFGGNTTTDIDTFPTQYQWGTLSDIHQSADEYDWMIETVRSFPGPTGYTRWLPIHSLFVLLDWILDHWQKYHVNFIVHYRLSS